MIRDINAGRFANRTNLVLVTHGLALRVFLMRYACCPQAISLIDLQPGVYPTQSAHNFHTRWFHWTLEQYLMVHNPPNAEVRVAGMTDHGGSSRVAGHPCHLRCVIIGHHMGLKSAG